MSVTGPLIKTYFYLKEINLCWRFAGNSLGQNFIGYVAGLFLSLRTSENSDFDK